MCVFCKIVAGEISSMKVYEDEHSLVFMDIAGDVDGHMLPVRTIDEVFAVAFRKDKKTEKMNIIPEKKMKDNAGVYN